MEYKDYYKTMGLEKTASTDDIKRAYRKLARQYHPDVSKEKDAESRFKEINEAYEVLKDPEKRKSYDQLGSNWKNGQGFNPQDFGGFGQRSAGHGDFSDFFEQFFGGGGAQRHHAPRQQAGEDLHTELWITLEEAFHGAQKTLQYECPIVEQGRQQRVPKAIMVKVPAGVSNGQQIRLTGQGSAGSHGAKAGDLYIKINIQDHAQFTVQGRDLSLNLAIAPWEAALGATVSVPTLAGAVEVKIPQGAKSGSLMRLKGRGLPGKVVGDQYLVLQIQAPVPTTPEQIDLYEKMKQLFPFDFRSTLQ